MAWLLKQQKVILMSGATPMKTDVLIIGGGLAGLAAASEVASRGHKVIVVDEGWALGGQLKQQVQIIADLPAPYSGLEGFKLAQALTEKATERSVKFLLHHEVIGLYGDGSVGLRNEEKMIQVAAECIIVATGAAESALPFPGWTLPGIMTIGAAQILINRERVYPGATTFVIGSSDMALEISRQMAQVGIRVVGIAEPSQQVKAKDSKILHEFQKTDIPLLLETTVTAATGCGRVEEVSCYSANDQAQRKYPVDFLCIDGGRQPILETLSILNCQFKYARELGGWLPSYTDDLESSIRGVFVAGQAAGVTCQAAVFNTGLIAGMSAADYLESTAKSQAKAAKQACWNELKRIESANYPEIWQARMEHIAACAVIDG
jgi:thioredoxin reductase